MRCAAAITVSSSIRPSAIAPTIASLWSRLARGESEAGQYKRLAKGGRELWVQASFNPILDAGGKPFKIVEYATDVTRAAELL